MRNLLSTFPLSAEAALPMQLSIAYAAAVQPSINEHLAATSLARSALQLALAARVARVEAQLAAPVMPPSEQAAAPSAASTEAQAGDVAGAQTGEEAPPPACGIAGASEEAQRH